LLLPKVVSFEYILYICFCKPMTMVLLLCSN
jgi:hypothetical protein